MVTTELKVTNKSGLHARPATDFAETAKGFQSSVQLTFNGKTKNAKSVIGILALGIKQNSTVTVSVDGEDEQEALNAILALAADNFHEQG